MPSISTSNDPSDADLVTRVARQDCAAFERIYDRYAGKAYGLCISILGDHVVSEDVLQESFWQVWQKARSYDPTHAGFSTWLFSIVHHCAVDELRRRRSRGGQSGSIIELDANDAESRKLLDPHADVTGTVLASIENERVKRALTQLSQAQRTTLVLAYYGGYTHQEIAVQQDESLSTVHTRARLGLSKLRDLLANLE